MESLKQISKYLRRLETRLEDALEQITERHLNYELPKKQREIYLKNSREGKTES